MSLNNTNQRSATDDRIELEEYPLLDPGVYHARLESVDTLDLQFGPTYKFTWKVLSGDSAGLTFDGLANKRLTPRSKLSDWAKAHLAIASFPSGFALHIGSLIGKDVNVVLSVEPRSDGQGECNRVQAVSPYKPATKKAKVASPPPDDFVEVFDGDSEIPDPGDPLRVKDRKVAA